MPYVSELLQAVPEIELIAGYDDCVVEHITTDSRHVRENSLFVAVRGVNMNGEDYVASAVEAGASAILCDATARVMIPESVTRLETKDVRKAVAKLAAAFYAPQPEHITAITGTDGKTSTAEFIRQLWEAVGEKSASIGTLGVRCTHVQDLPKFPNTTPDPVVLASILHQVQQQGVEHVAMEASSHGLHQLRLDGVRPRVAIFTTFGHDHGDYHPTPQDYFDAKARLFRELLVDGGRAVLNVDDATIAPLIEECRQAGTQVVGFGRSERADFRIVDAQAVEGGQRVELNLQGTQWQSVIPLYGAYQMMNVIAALAALWSEVSEAQRAQLLEALPHLTGVPGRLDRIVTLKGRMPVFTDYAHTADAIANVLRSLRPHVQNHLWIVFGCGGDRDASKRPKMGAMAVELADKVVVTDDNPRSEDPAAIRAAIMAAAKGAVEVGGRVEAITYALQHMVVGDVLVVAGKGHETTQIIGNVEHYHHDGETLLDIATALQLKEIHEGTLDR